MGTTEIIDLSIDKNFSWIDVTNPTKEDLEKIALDYNLHQTSVQDCMDPEHLPKVEYIENIQFIIIRFYDRTSHEDDDDIMTLTRKVAFFITDKVLITIHRSPIPFYESIKVKALKSRPETTIDHRLLALEIMKKATETFDLLFDSAEKKLEDYEYKIFNQQYQQEDLFELHNIKRRASVIKKLIWTNYMVIKELKAHNKKTEPHYQDLKELTRTQYYHSEELFDEAQNIINTQLSMSTYRANQIMQVLTLSSVFFMPLTFIVGVYGMNFKNMPELDWKYGYLVLWIIIGLISLSILYYFKRKGWLRN